MVVMTIGRTQPPPLSLSLSLSLSLCLLFFLFLCLSSSTPPPPCPLGCSSCYPSCPASSVPPSPLPPLKQPREEDDAFDRERGEERDLRVPEEGEERRFLDFPSPPIVAVGGLVRRPSERRRGTRQFWGILSEPRVGPKWIQSPCISGPPSRWIRSGRCLSLVGEGFGAKARAR